MVTMATVAAATNSGFLILPFNSIVMFRHKCLCSIVFDCAGPIANLAMSYYDRGVGTF
jgi:hypothetical protein